MRNARKKDLMSKFNLKQELDKFFIKEPLIQIENSNVDNVNLRTIEELVSSETMEYNIDFDATKINQLNIDLDAENVDSVNEIDIDVTKIDQLDADVDAENVDSVNDNCKEIFDPRIWDYLESKMIDLLACLFKKA